LLSRDVLHGLNAFLAFHIQLNFRFQSQKMAGPKTAAADAEPNHAAERVPLACIISSYSLITFASSFCCV
jgi:hypothetical protein